MYPVEVKSRPYKTLWALADRMGRYISNTCLNLADRMGLLACGLCLVACNDPGSGPVFFPPRPCENPSELALPFLRVAKHSHPVKVNGTFVSLPGMDWASADSVRSFFGGKAVKLVFTLKRQLYLVDYSGVKATVTRISHDDESLEGALGSINSPLFSPDGKKVVFAGTTRGSPAFILDAVAGNADAWRLPLDPRAHVTADPHWHSAGGKTWVYFATLSGLVNFSDQCGHINGSTYRVEVIGDTLLGPIDTTGIPGAYRGGLSLDGEWAGTSYATSAIYSRSERRTLTLGNGKQQCNPSMNRFPIGSIHTDYMMVLAFGGVNYATITGDSVTEGLHENLWIYNRNDKIVWQGKLSDKDFYLRWDKPEWSTHPQYATAVALQKSNGDGDLYVIKIGDLANADEGELNQAQGHFKIGSGGFTSDSYSHLWVEP